jgi:Tfp pilus assembly ATPase PilU
MTKTSKIFLSCYFPSLVTVKRKLVRILTQNLTTVVIIKILRKFNQLAKSRKEQKNIYFSTIVRKINNIHVHVVLLLSFRI